MYIFQRLSSDGVEVWSVHLPAEALPREDIRFGAPTPQGARSLLSYEVGTLIAMRREKKTEFMLKAHRNLSEEQREALVIEVEFLLGRFVHDGDEFEQAWVLHGTLSERLPGRTMTEGDL